VQIKIVTVLALPLLPLLPLVPLVLLVPLVVSVVLFLAYALSSSAVPLANCRCSTSGSAFTCLQREHAAQTNESKQQGCNAGQFAAC
jgi:hypothetical protein